MENEVNSAPDAASLPRSAKGYHVIVTEEIHRGLKMYAAKNHLSMVEATVRLLRAGLIAELESEGRTRDPRIAEINLKIQKLARNRLRKKATGKKRRV